MVLAGSLLGAAEKMLNKGQLKGKRLDLWFLFLTSRLLGQCPGMHPTIIAESFLKASVKAVEYLTEISTPVDLKDKAQLLRAASTSLNSKVGQRLD